MTGYNFFVSNDNSTKWPGTKQSESALTSVWVLSGCLRLLSLFLLHTRGRSISFLVFHPISASSRLPPRKVGRRKDSVADIFPSVCSLLHTMLQKSPVCRQGMVLNRIKTDKSLLKLTSGNMAWQQQPCSLSIDHLLSTYIYCNFPKNKSQQSNAAFWFRSSVTCSVLLRILTIMFISWENGID